MKSEALLDNATLRFDPEYFNKAALDAFRLVGRQRHLRDVVKEGYRVVYENTKVIDRDEGLASGLPLFLQSADITTPFINENRMACVPESEWTRYPKGRIQRGELLIEVKGRAEKVAVVPDTFPEKTLVSGTCFKILTRKQTQRSLLVAFLTGKYGFLLKDRLKTNLLVSYIAKGDLYRIPLPAFSDNFEKRIHFFVNSSLSMRKQTLEAQTGAEGVLLTALGLADWMPPEPLSYSARASDALAAERMDARFFAPRIQALLDILDRDGRSLNDVAAPRYRKFRPGDRKTFHYIEISDIDGAGATGSTLLACADAPSRAIWHVKPGDIITSTVRPIRRLSAQIEPEQDGYVCSSGFVVIDPRNIAPELLLTYLRLPVLCELLDLYASASMYPAITDAHILGLPIPKISAAIESQIVKNVRNARAAKKRASQLLDVAKRAVEIAIEYTEEAATAFLNKAESQVPDGPL